MFDSLKEFVELNLSWAKHEPENYKVYMMCAFGAVHMYCTNFPENEPMVANWWNNNKRSEFEKIAIDK